jgi:hypothetical protein
LFAATDFEPPPVELVLVAVGLRRMPGLLDGFLTETGFELSTSNIDDRRNQLMTGRHAIPAPTGAGISA